MGKRVAGEVGEDLTRKLKRKLFKPVLWKSKLSSGESGRTADGGYRLGGGAGRGKKDGIRGMVTRGLGMVKSACRFTGKASQGGVSAMAVEALNMATRVLLNTNVNYNSSGCSVEYRGGLEQCLSLKLSVGSGFGCEGEMVIRPAEDRAAPKEQSSHAPLSRRHAKRWFKSEPAAPPQSPAQPRSRPQRNEHGMGVQCIEPNMNSVFEPAPSHLLKKEVKQEI